MKPPFSVEDGNWQTEILIGIFCLDKYYFLAGRFFGNHLHVPIVRTTHVNSRNVWMSEMLKVLTSKAAAHVVGLSESTLAKLRLNGNGPIYCKLGRRVVYRAADLENWLQSRTARDTSDADARFLKALTVAHPR